MTIDVGIATLVLAFFTMLAVIVPLLTASRDRRGQQIAAIRQLYLIVDFHALRIQALQDTPQIDPEAFSAGLDVALSRGLSDDVGRSVPTDALLASTYGLFGAHDALAKAVSIRRNAGGVNNMGGGALQTIRSQCQLVSIDLLNAKDELHHAARKLGIMADLSQHTLHAIPEGAPNSEGLTEPLE